VLFLVLKKFTKHFTFKNVLLYKLQSWCNSASNWNHQRTLKSSASKVDINMEIFCIKNESYHHGTSNFDFISSSNFEIITFCNVVRTSTTTSHQLFWILPSCHPAIITSSYCSAGSLEVHFLNFKPVGSFLL